MKRHKSRPYIYVEACGGIRAWWLSGVQFRELIREYGNTNLLLLKHEFARADRHLETGLDYVRSEGLETFCEDDHYSYGDMALLDLPDISRLDGLPRQTVAELLYLAHAWDPVSTPFFPDLGNELSYLCHDDGWLAKVYVERPGRLLAVLSGIMACRLGRMHRRKVKMLPADLQGRLAHWAAGGLLFDLADSRKVEGELFIPIHVLGQGHTPFSEGGLGIDDLLSHLDGYKVGGERIVLRYCRPDWSLEL